MEGKLVKAFQRIKYWIYISEHNKIFAIVEFTLNVGFLFPFCFVGLFVLVPVTHYLSSIAL